MGYHSFHISSYRHVLRYEYLLDQRRGDETGEYKAVTRVARSKSRGCTGTSPEDAMIDPTLSLTDDGKVPTRQQGMN
jgi:hypothetical protein